MSAFASAAGSPIIDSDALIEWVRADFGVSLARTSQVLGGQDSDAVVVAAKTVDGVALAVKVSRSAQIGGLLLAAHISQADLTAIPAPLRTRSGQPYSIVSGQRLSLTPWISGRSGFEQGMNAQQWRSYGALLCRVHTALVPAAVLDRLPGEDFRTPATAIVRTLDARIHGLAAARAKGSTDDGLSAALVSDWCAADASLAAILAQVDVLGDELRPCSAPAVVCHGDAHIANLLLSDDGDVWLLDWDGAVRAPRERDLMFVLGGVLAEAPVTAEQQDWFFEGYGHADIDPILLAYYCCSWAVQDVADYAARVLDQPDPRSPAGHQALKLFRDALSSTGIVSRARDSLRQIGRIG